LIEVANGLAAPANRSLMIELLEWIQQEPRLYVIPVDQHELDEGLGLYAQRPDKSWSLTDCMSFTVMRKLDRNVVLTGDRHFEQAGFRILF
jgi:uncharacterized protein